MNTTPEITEQVTPFDKDPRNLALVTRIRNLQYALHYHAVDQAAQTPPTPDAMERSDAPSTHGELLKTWGLPIALVAGQVIGGCTFIMNFAKSDETSPTATSTRAPTSSRPQAITEEGEVLNSAE